MYAVTNLLPPTQKAHKEIKIPKFTFQNKGCVIIHNSVDPGRNILFALKKTLISTFSLKTLTPVSTPNTIVNQMSFNHTYIDV